MMATMVYRTVLVLSLALLGVAAADSTGSNATSILEAAGSYFGNLGESELAGYTTWLADRGSTVYSRHLFLPTVTDPENGAAIFWKFLAVSDGGSVAVGRSGSDIQATHIQFAIAVRSTGWVSLGISAAGGMLGSDVAMFETAKPTQIVDGHIIEERFPIVDDCQDWTLVSVHNDTSDGWLIVEMSRPLDTKDTQDHKIVDDANLYTPSRLIAAWGDTSEVSYHGTNVGKSTVKLFGEQESKNFDVDTAKLLEEMSDGYFDVRESNYTIPANETTYHYVCKTYAELKQEFNLPDTENDVLTFIGGGAVLTPETEPYVHHFIVSGSSSSDNCTDANTMLFGWAPGDTYQVLPENVGIPLFRPEGQFRSISIQIHYNNPTLEQGLVDSSGMRLYYTVAPREVEAAWLQVGDPLTLLEGTDIPDGLTEYTFSCGSDCSSAVLAADEPVTVIAETLHMHKTGVRMTSEIIRDGEVVKTGLIDVFEFSQQGSYMVQQEEFQIQSGDSFRTSCYYRDGSKFGLGSQEEMCIAFYLYYPAKQLDFGAFGTFPWMCLYGIDALPVCKEEMEFKSLSSDEELGRVFGTSPGSCSALDGDVGGTDGNGGQSSSAAGDGSTDAPSPSTVSSASSFVTALPLMVAIFVINACMRI